MSDDTIDPLAILKTFGLAGAAGAAAVSGGAATTIWRIDHADRSYALRLFGRDEAAMAAREIVAMRAAAECGLPAPEVHAEGFWRERPALLLTWMPGRPVKYEFGARPWRAWTLGRELGRMQAAIHRVPAPRGLSDHPIPWIEWANPDETLRRRLREAASGAEALLHLDYHPMNVLVQDRELSGVLDWANARAGDPRADLARTASILRFGPLADVLPASVAGIARRMLERGWRRGYRDVAGPVAGMAPFYAWAGAVMVRDLSPRAGREDLPWLTPGFLDRVRDWTADWRARAGLGP